MDENAQTVKLDAGTTKNGQGRMFPYGVLPELKAVITDRIRARKALKERGTIKPYVFADENGDRLPEFYSHVWRAACKAAGIPGKIPHDFRRTAVRNLTRANVPQTTAMALTGHKTASVFRYDIVDEADLREAVSKLAGIMTTRKRRASR